MLTDDQRSNFSTKTLSLHLPSLNFVLPALLGVPRLDYQIDSARFEMYKDSMSRRRGQSNMIEEDDSIGLDANTARLLLKSVRGYAIYLLDPGGHVTSWNPGAEAIKGYSAKEVLGKHFSIFYTPEDRTVGEPERELTAASSGVYKSEGWRLRKDGQRFWAGVTLTPLIDESNDLRGFAKVTQDMTEHRRAQEERIRLERAEEALLLRDKFLDEAKSSLNVILTSIRIHVNSLKATVEIVGGESSPAIKAKLTTLEWGLDRLSKMTDDVLSLAADTGNKLVRQLHQREL